MYYLDGQSMMLLGLFVAGLGGVFITIALCRRFYRMRKKTARRRREALDTVQKAISNRSVFDVYVEDAKGQPVHSFRGTCLAARQDSMTLALEKGGQIAVLQNARVHVYFRFAVNGTMRFYDFYSPVSAAGLHEGEARIVLPLPLAFGKQQRRSFVRYEPSEAFMEGFSLWFGYVVPTPSLKDGSTGDAGSAPPRPAQSLQWKPLPAASIRVQDISAGGLRLTLPLVLNGEPLGLGKGGLLLAQFTLNEPITPPALGRNSTSASASQPPEASKTDTELPAVTVAVVGDILRVVSRTSSQAEVGIRFRRWAQVQAEKKPTWTAIRDDEGISLVGSWVIRRLGEQMRKVGGTAKNDDAFTLRLEDEDD